MSKEKLLQQTSEDLLMLQKTIGMVKQEARNAQEAAETDQKGLAKRIKERERKVQ